MHVVRYVAAAAASLFLAMGSAHALPIISNDTNDFADVTNVVDFLSPPEPLGTEYTTQFSGLTISGGLFSIADPNDPTITFAANGIPPNLGPFNPITFTFDSTVTKFAIFGAVDENLGFSVNSTIIDTTALGAGVFAGVTDTDGFTTVSVAVPDGINFLGIASIAWKVEDTVTISEPSPLALMIAALIALGGFARMRARGR